MSILSAFLILLLFQIQPLEAVLQQVGISAWQQAGYNGSGVKVGIIDVGFAGADQLPAHLTIPTDAVHYFDAQSNHGTLVLETLITIAPEAEYFIFQLAPGRNRLSDAVDWMLAQGVQVVNYSASSLDLPLNGDNYQAQQMARLADQNVLVVTSMGNYGTGYITDTFRDRDGDGWHEFPSGREAVRVTPFLTEMFGVSHLRWQDSSYTSTDIDLDLYALSGDGGTILEAATEVQQGGSADWAYEDVFYGTTANMPLQLAIHAKGDIPEGTVFYLYAEDSAINGGVTEGSITAPADSAKILSIGAIEADGTLWSRSSRGPTWDGRIKPDLVAPTRFQLPISGEIFTGTSASTPIVTGAAILARQAYPQLSEAEIRHWFYDHAVDLGIAGQDNWFGYGMIWLPER